MTIKEAAVVYGVSPQAIYQRLKGKGYDVKALKNKVGELSEEGERLIAELFERVTVNGEGDVLTAQKQTEALNTEVEKLRAEVDLLVKQVEMLKEERDYLRRALDQSQQLHAMTMRMLPPAPVEKKGVFSRLFGKSKKEEATVQPSQPE